MEGRSLFDALIDVCPDCKGLWIDWYDGDLASVASDAAPLSVPHAPPVGSDELRAGCPRCQCALRAEMFLDEDKGPSIHRCAECGGAFVPRSSFDAIVLLAHRPDPETEATLSPFARLAAVLRALLRF
jgi:Zn-finger nucleic acid-binding protein